MKLINLHKSEKNIKSRFARIADEVGDRELKRIASDEYYKLGRITRAVAKSPYTGDVIKKFFQGMIYGEESAVNILGFEIDREALEDAYDPNHCDEFHFVMLNALEMLRYKESLESAESVFYFTEVLKPFRSCELFIPDNLVQIIGNIIEDSNPRNLEGIAKSLNQPIVFDVIKRFRFRSGDLQALMEDLEYVAEYTHSSEAVNKTAEVILKSWRYQDALGASLEITEAVDSDNPGEAVILKAEEILAKMLR